MKIYEKNVRHDRITIKEAMLGFYPRLQLVDKRWAEITSAWIWCSHTNGKPLKPGDIVITVTLQISHYISALKQTLWSLFDEGFLRYKTTVALVGWNL